MGYKTALYEMHQKAGAKMVDFAGWDMPIQYTSVMEEHHQVRKDAGMFDVSHMLTLDIKGGDAKRFIRYLLANDIARVAKEKAFYSCMLNENSGIVDDLIAYYFNDEFIRLVINAANRDSDTKWIKQHAKAFDVEIIVRDDLAIIAIQGPNARQKADKVLAEKADDAVKNLAPFAMVQSGEWMIARTGYTGEDGYEISLPAEKASVFWQHLQSEGVLPCGLAARDTLRLEAGMNLYGQDMDEHTTPIESGLMWTVSITDDRDFIGKSVLLAKKETINEQFVGLVLCDRGILRAGQVVEVDGGCQKGVITSGNFSPTLGQSIAMARIPKAAKEIAVRIRNKVIPAKIVKMPFVRKGKKVYKELEDTVIH
ncbi:glycine cleavage system aminomethyltransferase GcvT [Facilibium subflavum]|uniref:glycine cleavage system aminomethyltransferase GcvT n=1 Tax=Facilibium subflavum TaxID=2219058 RepID=UPI000E651BCC|nr:glycine cleavage system aminomethyltransferase GcvT [Facilibium subflavum]